MSVVDELWDSGTRNLVSAFESEAAALCWVHGYASDHGPGHGRDFAAHWTRIADAAREIASGAGLVDRGDSLLSRQGHSAVEAAKP